MVHRPSSFFHQRTGSEQRVSINDRKTNQLLINNYQIPALPDHQIINQVLKIAKSQIGIREATGNNDGRQVEAYLAYTGNKKGEPWCASFVSWVFGQAGFNQPRSAWSPALFPQLRQVKTAKPALVFGIYFPTKGRIAHVGLVEKQQGDWLYTIEGNTNLAGSREGDGVYRRLRHTKTIAAYADWLPDKKGALK
ncbi:MAG: CHAP domain-containing protein [Sphingobacteriales bacterium]|nr:MAG: CHAP domain-containing protein [Sphingobacteriales bacterium]